MIGLDGRMSDAGRRPRGPDAGRGGRGDRRLGQGSRLARQAGALPARRRHLRALPLPDRAAHLAAVVVRNGGARAKPAIEALRASARALSPGVAASVRDPVARGRTRLVPLAPALVGPSAADLVRRPTERRSAPPPRRRRRRRRGAASRSSAIPTSSTRGSRRRSGRSPRSAGRTRPPSSRRTTRATSTRLPARSSASGRTA